MKEYINLKHKYCRELLKKPNVVGVGVGKRNINEEATDEDAVVVFVSRKVPAGELKTGELIPRSLEGGTVDVIEIGEIKMLEEGNDENKPENNAEEEDELVNWEETGEESPPDESIKEKHNYPWQLCRKEPEPEPVKTDDLQERRKRQRPAPGGASIGHYRVTAGTLGAAVRDKEKGVLLALTNNHVAANSSTGNDGRASVGDRILQPGSHDGGRDPEDIWGYLERFIPFKMQEQKASCNMACFAEKAVNSVLSVFSQGYRVDFYRNNSAGNIVDAALVRPVDEKDLSTEIIELGTVSGTSAAFTGQEVVFSGRTSGIRRGKVLALDADMMVMMGSGIPVLFTDQLVTSAIAQPGDSGSLLLDTGNNAVGLLFAGSDRASICNRIENVLELLDIEF